MVNKEIIKSISRINRMKPAETTKTTEKSDVKEFVGKRVGLIKNWSEEMAAIRKLMNDPSLKLKYVAISPNPYRDDESMINTFTDGYVEYWVDRDKKNVVQAGPESGQAPYQVRPADRLPVAELRRLAVELIEAGLPDFAQRRSSLHPLEDNRDRQVYFFRWDDFSAPLREAELPPFVQVALYADGRLASYTDTLSR